MSSGNVIEDIIDGLETYRIYRYNDAPLGSEEDVDRIFAEKDMRGVVVKEGDLRYPDDALQSFYESIEHYDSWSFTSTYQPIILIEVLDKGGANFYYAGTSKEVSILKEELGTSTLMEPGEFLLEHYTEDILPIEELETETTAVVEGDTTIGEVDWHNVTTTLFVGLIAIVLIGGIVASIIGSITGSISPWIWSEEDDKTPEKLTDEQRHRSEKPEDDNCPQSISFLNDDEIRGKFVKFKNRLNYHKQLSRRGTPNLVPELENFIHELTQLDSIELSEEQQQKEAIYYAYTLDKMNNILGQKYWGQFASSPEYYDNSDQQLDKVKKVVQNATEEARHRVAYYKKLEIEDMSISLKMLEDKQSRFKTELELLPNYPNAKNDKTSKVRKSKEPKVKKRRVRGLLHQIGERMNSRKINDESSYQISIVSIDYGDVCRYY